MLVSKATDKAYYEGEEITLALQLAREDGTRYRVIPVYLDDANRPFGLLSKHEIRLSKAGSLEGIADRVEHTVDAQVRKLERRGQLAQATGTALQRIVEGRGKERVKGVRELFSYHPVIGFFFGMVFLCLALGVAGFATPVFGDARMVASPMLFSSSFFFGWCSVKSLMYLAR